MKGEVKVKGYYSPKGGNPILKCVFRIGTSIFFAVVVSGCFTRSNVG